MSMRVINRNESKKTVYTTESGKIIGGVEQTKLTVDDPVNTPKPIEKPTEKTKEKPQNQYVIKGWITPIKNKLETITNHDFYKVSVGGMDVGIISISTLCKLMEEEVKAVPIKAKAQNERQN